MILINVKGGNIEGALKEYKRKIHSVKQIEQLRQRQTYIKPSVQKREIIEKAKRKSSKNY